MATQIERQYGTPIYEGKRPLALIGLEDAVLDDAIISDLDQFLASATIPDIQARFADGTLNSETLVKYYIQRIKTYDVDGYNSVLELNPDALTIARQCDAERDNDQGSMFGIPVLLKDNIGTGDKMHTTAGAKALEDSQCDRDAFIVQQMRDAGAIILGKCNLSEWANFMSFESSNGFTVLGGQVRNAYGQHDVGGSSSGSGAAAGAGFATVTVGTETAGSLISPASQNGCCTIKPSLGLISRDRIIPITVDQDTAGPITRSMTDLAHFLNVLAGVDANDRYTQRTTSIADTDFTDYLNADALQGKRIGITERVPDQDPKTGDSATLDQAAEIMQALGATVVRTPYVMANFDLWTYFYAMNKGVNEYLEAIGDGRTLADIVAWNAEDEVNRAPFGQGLLHLSSLVPLNAVTEKAYQRLHYSNAASASHGIRSTLRDYNLDAIVDINNYSTVAYAVSGYPAVSVPAGYRESGEPVSITLFGDYLQDANLISYAYAYEQHRPARQAPQLILPSDRQ
ncbi:MAG: amidase family protein [Phototrophicaceae bacterium]